MFSSRCAALYRSTATIALQRSTSCTLDLTKNLFKKKLVESRFDEFVPTKKKWGGKLSLQNLKELCFFGGWFLKKSENIKTNPPFVKGVLNMRSRWWFQIFNLFSSLPGGKDPIWRAYFSNGLKPPPRWDGCFLFPRFVCWCFWNPATSSQKPWTGVWQLTGRWRHCCHRMDLKNRPKSPKTNGWIPKMMVWLKGGLLLWNMAVFGIHVRFPGCAKTYRCCASEMIGEGFAMWDFPSSLPHNPPSSALVSDWQLRWTIGNDRPRFKVWWLTKSSTSWDGCLKETLF